MKDINHDDTLKQSIHDYQGVLGEYNNLSRQPVLSEIGAKRLEHILEMACHDAKLSLLLNEIDGVIFGEQGVEEQQTLQNEVARVLELIDGDIPIHKTVFEQAKLNLVAYEPLLEEYYQLLQKLSLSETEAARMGQILDAAYEDELLFLLINILNDKVAVECGTEQSVQLQVAQVVELLPMTPEIDIAKKLRKNFNASRRACVQSYKSSRKARGRFISVLAVSAVGVLGILGLGCLLKPNVALSVGSQSREKIGAISTDGLKVSPVSPRPPMPELSCSDVWTKINDTYMWPVYISHLTVTEVQELYCADAFSVERNDTGARAVQIARFFNEDRAKRFAQKVYGEVGLPVLLKKSRPTDFCGDDLQNKQLMAFAVLVDGDLKELQNVCLDAVENGDEVQMAVFATKGRANVFAADWNGRVVPKEIHP